MYKKVENTINPSYTEINNKKKRPKHDPTNEKKRTEGSNEDAKHWDQRNQPESTKNFCCDCLYYTVYL